MAGTIAADAHGIPHPNTLPDLTPQEKQFHQAMYNAVVRLQGSLAPPNRPTNLRVDPTAAGNRVSFSRSNANHYVVYSAATPNFETAVAHPVGQAQQFDHDVAQGNTQQFYWVQGFNANGRNSEIVGPKSATTLAQGTDTTLPATPPAVIPPSGVDQVGHEIQIKDGEVL